LTSSRLVKPIPILPRLRAVGGILNSKAERKSGRKGKEQEEDFHENARIRITSSYLILLTLILRTFSSDATYFGRRRENARRSPANHSDSKMSSPHASSGNSEENPACPPSRACRMAIGHPKTMCRGTQEPESGVQHVARQYVRHPAFDVSTAQGITC